MNLPDEAGDNQPTTATVPPAGTEARTTRWQDVAWVYERPGINPITRLQYIIAIAPYVGVAEPDEIREALRFVARAERSTWRLLPDGGECKELESGAPRLAHLLWGWLCLDSYPDCDPESAATARAVREALNVVEQEVWPTAGFIRKGGAVRPLLANAEHILRTAPEWQGVLAYDEFAQRIVMKKAAPWAGARADQLWSDQEDRLTAIWLQRHEIQVSDDIAGKAAQTVARDWAVHPVREYLSRLHWDGTGRIDSWLTTHLGVVPNAYTAAVGLRWLIAAVARIYRPGVKADCCLILEGPQGGRKSTALRTLADPWFTDEIAELGSKDAALQTRGVWIIELAELDAMSGADVAKVKAFMSRSTDRFRPPYGRQLIESPRQCVFAGTVNQSTYLKDETGGRRFWPVRCGEINIEALARDCDQLWAEAAARYRAGSAWWLDSRELNTVAAREQGDRYEGDAWDTLISAWVKQPFSRPDGMPLTPLSSSPDSVCIAEILFHAIGKRPEHWTQTDRNRVARCLRSMGYERYRHRNGEQLEWRYRRR